MIRKKGMQLLLTAKEKGYAVDEMDKVIKTHILHSSSLKYNS